jgi:phage gp45-like
MIITIIRSILSSLGVAFNTAKTAGYRTFFGTGRADEHISGKMYQHYGFASMPPEGAELITMQYGNNNISIAENDGSVVSTVDLQKNDVMVYAKNGDEFSFLNMFMKLGSVLMSMETTGDFAVQADKDITLDTPDGNIEMSATSGTMALKSTITLGKDSPNGYFPLLTINFYNNEFSSHTHNVTAVGSPTGPAIIIPGTLPKATSNTEAN